MNCLYPILVRNPRISSDRFLKRVQAFGSDFDTLVAGTPLFISVPCGRCFECLRSRANEWRTRLLHENQFGGHDNGIFVTLTFSPEYYRGIDMDTRPFVRKFFDNWRYRFAVDGKKAPRPFHFLIEELGDDNNRLHLHGIFWDIPFYFTEHDFPDCSKALMNEVLSSLWPYGNTWVGYLTDSTASYVTKYITKTTKSAQENGSDDYFNFRGRIYCSPGIGSSYISESFKASSRFSMFSGEYPSVFVNGFRTAVPRYYLSKVVDENEAFYLSIRRVLDAQIFSQGFRKYFRGQLFTDPRLYEAHLSYVRSEYDRLGIRTSRSFSGNFDIRNNLDFLCSTFNKQLTLWQDLKTL